MDWTMDWTVDCISLPSQYAFLSYTCRRAILEECMKMCNGPFGFNKQINPQKVSMMPYPMSHVRSFILQAKKANNTNY